MGLSEDFVGLELSLWGEIVNPLREANVKIA